MIGLLALVLAAGLQDEDLPEEPISYGCSDLVVIGRASSLGYTPVAAEDDLLGHGWITARIKPRKVLKQKAPPGEIPVRYFAHAPLNRNLDFLFVLSKEADGEYVIKAASLMAGKPRLAPQCS